MPTTTVPAAAEGLPHTIDLEDQICRVRWMAKMAWDTLRECPKDIAVDDQEKVRHLVRATQELAESLWLQFYGRTMA